MNDGAASRRPRVIIVADGEDQRFDALACAVNSFDIDTTPHADVYLAMGDIAGLSDDLPVAVVVSMDAIEPADMEFFSLVRRHLNASSLYVLPGRFGNGGLLREALAAGIRCIDMTKADLWAATLVPDHRYEGPARPLRTESKPVQAAEGIDLPKHPLVAGSLEQAEPVPRPIKPTERRWVPPEQDDRSQPKAAGSSTLSLRLAQPEPVAEAQEPEIIREECILDESLPVADCETVDDGANRTPVPWKPASNRPMRTPPGAVKEPPRSQMSSTAKDQDIELTREELDALLGRDETRRARKQSL